MTGQEHLLEAITEAADASRIASIAKESFEKSKVEVSNILNESAAAEQAFNDALRIQDAAVSKLSKVLGETKSEAVDL